FLTDSPPEISNNTPVVSQVVKLGPAITENSSMFKFRYAALL
ncbi:hypothetical protein A2U01_0069705, partial [Trifolium medium]|nr:hypothetical protein [Trifolium medium]